MAEFDDKTNGNTVDASEYNAIVRETRNAILDGGQSLNGADDHQFAKSMANYGAIGGVFGNETGVANAYVVTPLSPLLAATRYDGMKVSFRAVNANTGASTINVGSLGVKNIKKADGVTNPVAGDIPIDKDTDLRYDGTNFRIVESSSKIVQIVNTQTGTVATGSTGTVVDDTIPQNTEGNEYMSLAITPTNVSNKLLIQVVCNITNDTQLTGGQVNLFQDSTADAIAVATNDKGGLLVGSMSAVTFSHYMTAGTTSSTTFKVRAGFSGGGVTTFNGFSGARKYGGRIASSITIIEIRA